MNSIYPNSKTSPLLSSNAPSLASNGERESGLRKVVNSHTMVRNHSNANLQLGQSKRELNRSSFTRSYAGHDFANFHLNALKKKVQFNQRVVRTAAIYKGAAHQVELVLQLLPAAADSSRRSQGPDAENAQLLGHWQENAGAGRKRQPHRQTHAAQTQSQTLLHGIFHINDCVDGAFEADGREYV